MLLAWNFDKSIWHGQTYYGTYISTQRDTPIVAKVQVSCRTTEHRPLPVVSPARAHSTAGMRTPPQPRYQRCALDALPYRTGKRICSPRPILDERYWRYIRHEVLAIIPGGMCALHFCPLTYSAQSVRVDSAINPGQIEALRSQTYNTDILYAIISSAINSLRSRRPIVNSPKVDLFVFKAGNPEMNLQLLGQINYPAGQELEITIFFALFFFVKL